jgi:hypothetical protein
LHLSRDLSLIFSLLISRLTCEKDIAAELQR